MKWLLAAIPIALLILGASAASAATLSWTSQTQFVTLGPGSYRFDATVTTGIGILDLQETNTNERITTTPSGQVDDTFPDQGLQGTIDITPTKPYETIFTVHPEGFYLPDGTKLEFTSANPFPPMEFFIHYYFGQDQILFNFDIDNFDDFAGSGFIATLTPIPEPAAWLTMTAGAFGLGALLRRRRKAKSDRSAALA